MEQRIRVRVLIAKLGLDVHDRGAKMLVLALRDSGMEVIYTGLRQTPETVLKTVIEEDVDVLGLSFLSGTHLMYTEQIMKLLKKERLLGEVKVVVGGTIPVGEIDALRRLGVVEVFPTETSTTRVVDFIKSLFQQVQN
jgi:methylmalonyl-CoA mutase C-terminal domain/subunit